MIQHILSTEALKALNAVPAAFWWWAWIALYAAGSLLVLWVLSLVKNVTGWVGVVVILLGLTYGYGWARGYVHASINPFSEPFHISKVIK